MPSRRSGLGKGLGALIPTEAPSTGVRRVSLDAIVPNPHQPRSVFDPDALDELATSIREVGLIQPLVVTLLSAQDSASPMQRYQLITGERRLRAAHIAGLEDVEVIIKDVSSQGMLEMALVENIQRADLNPLEEAVAYEELSQDFGLTQEQIAGRVGRSRVSVTNTLRLLRLPKAVRQGLLDGQITEGHARALLMLDDEDEQALAFRTVVKRQLSVRQTEELVRRLSRAGERPTRRKSRSPETAALERQFRESLGTKVDLFRSRKGGRIVIHFYSEEDLQNLYERFADK